MSRWISVEQLNGQTLVLEVTPGMAIRQVKQMIKDMQTWEDEVSRDTAVVELIFGDKKVSSFVTVAQAGLAEDSKVSAVFRPNVAQWSNADGFSPDVHPDALVIARILDSETEIIDWAFAYADLLAKVIIPATVTHIGVCAFYDCSRLTSVTIPDSVIYLGESVFNGCCSLATVNIPGCLTHTGDYAFQRCGSLVSVTIPESMIHIGNGAFLGCFSLVSVDIPASVTHIGVAAFLGCGSLETVTIPDSVTQIGDDAFSGCPRLSLTLPTRLLRPEISVDCSMIAKECGYDQ